MLGLIWFECQDLAEQRFKEKGECLVVDDRQNVGWIENNFALRTLNFSQSPSGQPANILHVQSATPLLAERYDPWRVLKEPFINRHRLRESYEGIRKQISVCRKIQARVDPILFYASLVSRGEH